MKLIHTLSLVLSLSSAALADIQFLTPAAGSTAKGGDTLTVHWKDSGNPPKLSEFTKYDLFLCAGGDSVDSIEELALLIKDGAFARGNSVSFRVDTSVGGNEPNAYFLKMVSYDESGSSVVNYSPRFSLLQMTGTFSDRVKNGLLSLSRASETEALEDNEELRKRQVQDTTTTTTTDIEGMFTVPYQDQLTGLTKYAPMAKQPGTTITAKTPVRQFPTSAYIIATTFLPEPTVQTTITAPQTFSVSSIENTASPAPQPSDDMKRFLKRWED
ncbi:hypothetical protein VTN77DRAFT_2466 [Rasamsonia byssochlamydoides]|uniref:uncharacterized protein n=1 Tax=Rasamsonia byssochlamydoides TaxID=89139 RepID=UPI003742D573